MGEQVMLRRLQRRIYYAYSGGGYRFSPPLVEDYTDFGLFLECLAAIPDDMIAGYSVMCPKHLVHSKYGIVWEDMT